MNIPTKESFLGQISIQEFLEDYWQKKPLLIKNFHKEPSSLASIQNIIDMAKDDNYESRIVFPPEKKNNWKAKEGPIDESDLLKKEWTIAIHGLDLYFEEFHQIKNQFLFIPAWQFDDIMATYSKVGTGVGAHIDNYDVFILQGQGKRKWQLELNPNPDYINDIEIKILKEFNPDLEWTLEPGDLIYIPPQVAHHGVTIEESISYSIGFKAEDSDKIMNSYGMHFLSEYESSDCIRHKTNINMNSPYEVTDENFQTIKDHMMEKFFNKEYFKKWVMGHVTTPRKPIPEGELIKDNFELIERIKEGEELYKDPHSRFSYYRKNEKIILYISTREFSLEENQFNKILPILETPSFNTLNINQIKSDSELMSLVRECIQYGIFYFYS